MRKHRTVNVPYKDKEEIKESSGAEHDHVPVPIYPHQSTT